MVLKYDIDIDKKIIHDELKKITNQVYKLLPNRAEYVDWETPLSTIMEELAGMDRVLIDQHNILFPLLNKLEGLFTLTNEDDFFLYRRTIFECISLVNSIIQKCKD